MLGIAVCGLLVFGSPCSATAHTSPLARNHTDSTTAHSKLAAVATSVLHDLDTTPPPGDAKATPTTHVPSGSLDDSLPGCCQLLLLHSTQRCDDKQWMVTSTEKKNSQMEEGKYVPRDGNLRAKSGWVLHASHFLMFSTEMRTSLWLMPRGVWCEKSLPQTHVICTKGHQAWGGTEKNPFSSEIDAICV